MTVTDIMLIRGCSVSLSVDAAVDVWQEDTVPVVMTEFDYLISKKKLEEDEDFKDFINPVTKAEVRETSP